MDEGQEFIRWKIRGFDHGLPIGMTYDVVVDGGDEDEYEIALGCRKEDAEQIVAEHNGYNERTLEAVKAALEVSDLRDLLYSAHSALELVPVKIAPQLAVDYWGLVRMIREAVPELEAVVHLDNEPRPCLTCKEKEE